MRQRSGFTVTPSRRPLWQRLTPAAWALIGVLGLILLLACAGGGIALFGRQDGDEVWDPTATPTVPPTATAVLPTPSPTITPTVESGAPYPAWWSDQMTQDEEGNWWPPEEVVEMVKEHYDRSITEPFLTFFPEGGVPDLDGLVADTPNWFSGPQLERQLIWLAGVRAGTPGADLIRADWEECLVQVQDWSSDGLQCTLGRVCQNGTIHLYDASGQLIETEYIAQGSLVLWRMQYDPADGHWKHHDLLEIIQSSGG